MSESNYTYGMFVWRELYTTDMEASRRFYGELLGWKITKAEMPGVDYYLAHAGEKQVAGLFAPDNGTPSMWNSYVSVPDVDAAAAAASASGAKVINGPMDIPGIGRMATFLDPQGALLSVYKDAKGDPPGGQMPKAGEFCWEQLETTDLAAAKAFYPKVVGWQVQDFNGIVVFGMGPKAGAASVHEAQPGVPAHWSAHVAVPKLADANARATRLGATVLVERIDVPTVGSFSVVRDNVGALINLFEGLPQ